MIFIFALPYFIYYDLRCYDTMFRYFGPILKLLLWWDCFNLISSYSIFDRWLGHNYIFI